MAYEGELSMASTAKVLGVDRETVSRWIKRGGVFERWRRSASGRTYIPRSEVARVPDSRGEVHDDAAEREKQQQAANLRALFT